MQHAGQQKHMWRLSSFLVGMEQEQGAKGGDKKIEGMKNNLGVLPATQISHYCRVIDVTRSTSYLYLHIYSVPLVYLYSRLYQKIGVFVILYKV
jgi:hypothetical protein